MTRRAAVVARGSGAAPSGSDDSGGLLRCTSGSKKTSGSFIAGSSTSSQPSIAASGVENWHAMVAARVPGLNVLQNEIQTI
jgi:hypothetical protein